MDSYTLTPPKALAITQCVILTYLRYPLIVIALIQVTSINLFPIIAS